MTIPTIPYSPASNANSSITLISSSNVSLISPLYTTSPTSSHITHTFAIKLQIKTINLPGKNNSPPSEKKCEWYEMRCKLNIELLTLSWQSLLSLILLLVMLVLPLHSSALIMSLLSLLCTPLLPPHLISLTLLQSSFKKSQLICLEKNNSPHS